MATSLPTTIQPTIEIDKEYKQRILETDFGDGYKQRAADGINTTQRVYTVTWIGSNTDIDELINHFIERGGYKNFTWTPPDETNELKWICKNWTVTTISIDIKKLTATLEQVYDLS